MNTFWGKILTMVGFAFLFAWTVFADQQPAREVEVVKESLQLIVESMESTGAEAERIQLHYGSTHQTFSDVKEVQAFAEKLGEQVGLTKEAANHESTTFTFHRLHQGVHTTMRVIAIPSHNQTNEWNSYVTIKLNAEVENMKSIENQLTTMYKGLGEFHIIPLFNTCVQGKYNGKLKNDVQLLRVDQIFENMGAVLVEQMQDPTVKSFSAYTPHIASSIVSNGQRMNVQAGLHIDQLEGITRLTVGTPIITMEY
jgi:hypothetical protein